MGTYVNPGNESFESDVCSKIYVDKTGLLKILNGALGTGKRYFAVSRARRFGKSMAAGMICAYYSLGADSKELFLPYEIAKDPDFERHLNKYNVLHFDVSSFLDKAKTMEDVVALMDRTLLGEMKEEFPYLEEKQSGDTATAINIVYKRERRKFIIIIDEYDCIVRDASENEKLILEYLKYLRGFFKTEESKRFLALGYITGILPIKKVKGESALNNFTEYTMTDPDGLITYFGFTEAEVAKLCERYGMPLKDMQNWYDGYYMYASIPGLRGEEGEKDADGSVRIVNERLRRLFHIYNPNSVVEALMRDGLISYWKNTGSFAALGDFIQMNYAGLKDDIIHMMTGERLSVNIKGFQNDLTQFKKKDDVLTCLIHMGYLGYDAYMGETFIPNKEVAEVFEVAVGSSDWDDVANAINNSDELLRATWKLDERKVLKVISESHQDYASIINFHDENALALAIMISYYTARADYYVKRDLPAGRGFADIVFIPKVMGTRPAMLVELKWNRSARAAIRQIKDKSYTGVLSGYKGHLILVGINYTKKTGKYSCRIEKIDV